MQETIISPSLGQQLTFSAASNADALRIEALIDPEAGTPPHIHLSQTEEFRVLEGELSVWIDGRRRTLEAGEGATVPPHVGHRFRNDSDQPVRVAVELRPALRSRELFGALFALDRAGKLKRMGAPGPIDAALLVDEFGAEFFYPSPLPPRLLRGLAAPLAALGRRLGRSLP